MAFRIVTIVVVISCRCRPNLAVKALVGIYRVIRVLKYYALSDYPLQSFADPNVYAEFNQSTVNITCDICANPQPDDDAYNWIANGEEIGRASCRERV